MRTDVDHLPHSRQRDLKRLVQILFEVEGEFDPRERNRADPAAITFINTRV